VATTSSTGLMTFTEFERLPESSTGRQELRHGEVFTLSLPKHKHYRVQRQLRRLLEDAPGDAGEVEIEMGFRPLPEHEYRIADVAFLVEGRWKGIPGDGFLSGAPDLVIEVLSPSNTAAEMIDKKTLCLENGSREFWVVDLDHLQVEVSTPDGRGITYKSGQHIQLFFAPGEQLAVDAIFA
jgi:Uma2 family endonuclease